MANLSKFGLVIHNVLREIPRGTHRCNYSPCALAGASINAKIVGTLIGYSGFATIASPTRWARTGVRALTGVETGGAIFAWVVICAIIQILVAK
jgi:hypothetical protein